MTPNLFFFFSIIALMCGHTVRVIRWRLILEKYQSGRAAWFFLSLVVGYFCNFIFPLRLGELTRAIVITKTSSCSFPKALGSIFIERFVDLISIAFFVLIFILFHGDFDQLGSSFIMLSLGAVFLYLVGLSRAALIKRLTYQIASLFNQEIKRGILNFFWGLRLLNPRLLDPQKKFKFVISSLLMWALYSFSVYFLSLALETKQAQTSTSLFELIYLRGYLTSGFFQIRGSAHFPTPVFGYLFGYYLIPIGLIFVYVLIFSVKGLRKLRLSEVFTKLKPAHQETLFHLNAFQNPTDQLSFFQSYFFEQNQLVEKVYRTNSDIAILKDLSSGSNAITLAIRERHCEKIRKLAFGQDTSGLHQQVSWLNSLEKELPVASVLGVRREADMLSYDMPYSPNNLSFFEVIHTLSQTTNKKIIANIIERLEANLYKACRQASDEEILNYYSEKVFKNLNFIRSHLLPNLVEPKSVFVNGVKFRNIGFFEEQGFFRNFTSLIHDRRVGTIHGDLTIENIIIKGDRLEEDVGQAWYLIDPNPNNIFNSKWIDYSKLFQSLDSGYEFLGRIPRVETYQNNIRFPFFKSTQYTELVLFLIQLLGGTDSLQVQDVKLHQIVNYFRLIPYKIKKGQKNCAAYYATLIVLLNDYWNSYVQRA